MQPPNAHVHCTCTCVLTSAPHRKQTNTKPSTFIAPHYPRHVCGHVCVLLCVHVCVHVVNSSGPEWACQVITRCLLWPDSVGVDMHTCVSETLPPFSPILAESGIPASLHEASLVPGPLLHARNLRDTFYPILNSWPFYTHPCALA